MIECATANNIGHTTTLCSAQIQPDGWTSYVCNRFVRKAAGTCPVSKKRDNRDFEEVATYTKKVIGDTGK